MSEYSPAPWTWVEVRIVDAEGFHLQDANGAPILTGGADVGEGRHNGVVVLDEKSVDARLIKAAPNLLKALRSAIFRCFSCPENVTLMGMCSACESATALIRYVEKSDVR